MHLNKSHLVSICISVFLLTGVYRTEAQESDFDAFSVNENIPKSPEAATLGQFGDVANNPYNGKANISVPIYNLNFEGIQIPIQLSYDSGGVRVASEASWVGLNWSMSTQFGISRQINAVDDFRPNGYINNQYVVSGTTMDYEDVKDIHTSFIPTGGLSNEIDMQPDIFDVNLFGMSYKFRLNKKGGTDIVDAHVFNNKNVRVEYDTSNESFKLTDEKGFVYEFSTKDYSTTFMNSDAYEVINGASSAIVSKTNAQNNIINPADTNKANESLITSWYLDKITSPNLRVLDFSYQAGAYFTFPSVNGVVRINDTGSNFITNTSEMAVPVGSATYSASTTIIENHYLNKISGDFGEINFVLGDRDDLLTGEDLNDLLGPSPTITFITANGTYRQCHGMASCNGVNDRFAHKLNRIEVINSNNETVVGADFTYTYFNEDENNGTDKARYIRLKLDKVTINDQNYFFNYEQPDALPAKDSFDVDFWGFYNGAGNDTNNLGNVPSIGRFITQDINAGGYLHIGQSYFDFDGANRGADFDFGQIGLLTRVVYPTGGYSSLCYEAHDAVIDAPQPYLVTDDFTFVGVDRYQWTNMVDESKYKFTYQYLKKAKKPNYSFFDQEFVQSPTAQETAIQIGSTFTVTATSLIRASGTLITQSGADPDGNFINHRARYVENVNDPDEYNVLYFYGDWPISTGAENGISKDALVIIGPGTYTLKREHPTPVGAPAISMAENEDNVATSPYTLLTFPSGGGGINLSDLVETFEIGGARVSSITNYDKDDAFISKKVYEYKDPNAADPGLSSSGKLMDDLIFFSKTYGFHSYNPRGWNSSPLQLTSSNPLRTTPSAQGSHIGYTYTTERSVDESNNILGRIERTFFNELNRYVTESFCREFRNAGCTQPFEYTSCVYNTYVLGMDPRISYGHANGNVLFENIYDQSGTLVRTTENTYTSLLGNTDDTLFASFIHHATNFFEPDGCSIAFGSDGTTYITYKFPNSFASKSVLSESKVIDKFENDLTSTQIQNYNPDTHHLMESILVNSKGEEVKSQYFYPYDTEVASENHMTTLVNENRISSPIKTDTYVKDSLQSSQIVNYANDALTMNIAQPSFVEFAKASSGTTNGIYEQRFKYEQYGPFGKIRQLRSEEGIPIVFVWGYNDRHVVAKIENTTVAQVEALNSFGANFDLGNGGLSSTQENDLRNNLSNAMVTTYLYKPLVGVTSITDPRGYTMTYIYDSSNRLKEVRDQDNNLVSDYKYEYVTLQQN